MNKCQCSCGKIKFTIPHKPKEIARCYCSICRSLHSKEFASFTKFLKQDIVLDINKMKQIESSTCAKRYKCSDCNDWICMIYNNSDNIWIVIENFLFPLDEIKTYDIYRHVY